MAPKQRANRGDPSNSVNTADITNKHSTEEQRQWDGQPYLKPNWYMRNKRALYTQHATCTAGQPRGWIP